MPIRVATVRAADIPSSQTDFPFYVDLGRVGATALTLAEAQSSRWYTDTDLVTEMAREIVSLTEGHGKYASLTSTSKIAIDYDGIRADYGVGATFGRNNVWSASRARYHLNDTTDSTGNGFTLTNNNSVSFNSQKIANGGDTGASNTNKTLSIDASGPAGISYTQFGTAWSNGGWFNPYTTSGFYSFYGIQVQEDSPTNRRLYRLTNDAGTLKLSVFDGTSNLYSTSQSLVVDTWYHLIVVFTGTQFLVYANGVNVLTQNRSLSTFSSSQAGGLGIFCSRFGNSNFDVGSIRADEFYTTESALSANWITTEYNNQNAESTFWGTWTTFGGGGFTPTPLMHMRMMAGGGVQVVI